MRRRLARGRLDVDARLDLHGLGQDAAFARLGSFLQTAQAQGKRLVLVITGKGDESLSERGILRRNLPHWLAHRDLRPLIAGVEQASRRHGGGGAFYIRLKRRR
ncbi:Smr/MutS family protein [Propylenella binzhouense]|uniref:Smr/MutS family protein n=1 Tax=Propylenella binzhouense TaxID=2555902 RepID=UPI0031B5BED0